MGATDSFLSLIPETTESKSNKQMYGYAKTYDKFNPEEVSNLVIHHTGGDTPEGAMAWWKNPQSKGVGAHYIINKDGSVIETAPMTHSTGHIMPDLATKKINNRTSLGIEIVGKSDKDVTQAQKDAVKRLYEEQILPTYPNIKLENIRGHGELAKGYTGSHARPEDEGSSVVNFLRAKQANPEQSNGFTSLIPSETIEPVAENQGYYNPQTEYKPGFYNPNMVAQGIRAREAGGGNLAPVVANTAEALKNMSYEDWKKNSLTANLLKAGIMPNPYMLSKANREEGRQKLGEIGKGLYEAVTNPGQTLEAISNLKPEEFIPEMVKGGIYDLPLGLVTKPLTEGAKVIGKAGMNVARNRIINPIAETYEGRISPRQALNELQQPKASVTIEGANYQPELNTQPVTKTVPRDVSDLNDAEFQKYINRPIGEDYNFGTKQITTNEPQMAGGGAALTSNAEAVKNALYQSNPELVANLIKGAGVKSFDEIPFDKLPLDVIERHNKFHKFDMTPTEGEALQDIKKMSQETNDRTRDELIRGKLEDRDPKLIAGFNKIRETVAPDVYESNPAKLANASLEKMVENYNVRTANEQMLYKRLADANGGNLPFDITALKNDIDNSLQKAKVFRVTKKNGVYKELQDQINTGTMTFDDFEHFRTALATEMRASTNGNVTKGLNKIYDALHEMPLPENVAHLRPLADDARNAFREHKQLQKDLPAYKTAINDIRSDVEKSAGTLHPASSTFLDKFYGPKTSQVEINRLLNELGIDSLEHQSLNAATIDKIKRASGVKGELGNETGRISQATLSDQLNKIYGNNASTMFKQEHLKDLKDLSDVANMTEHVKGQHSVATSNTPLEMERLRKKELAENLALNLGEGVVNLGTKGFGGTIARKLYEIKKGKSLQEAAEQEARLKAEKRVSPTAGISLEDLMNTGKK